MQVLKIQQIMHWIDRTNALFAEVSLSERDFINKTIKNLNRIKDLLNNIPKEPGFYMPTSEQVSYITTEIHAIVQNL
jgi:hypothetical protein